MPGWHLVVRNSSQGQEMEDWKWSLVSSLQLEEAARVSSPADQLPSSPSHAQMWCYSCMCVTFMSWRQSWRNSCCPNWRNSRCQNWRNSLCKNRLNLAIITAIAQYLRVKFLSSKTAWILALVALNLKGEFLASKTAWNLALITA